jgi:2-polyprenyl-3-methyl-5-hydroxy-6-metoxy-1,4-benzoquinol methylase
MNPHIALPDVVLVDGRQDFIVARCRGKRVLHLGCVDAGLLDVRFERGEHLHQKLAGVSRDLWGVDIDTEGIEFLRRKGFEKLVQGDVSQLDQLDELRDTSFDVIVASEVIEHLLNPGLMLASVRKLMVAGGTDLIVTVPNAFRIDTLLRLLRGIEYVHPDHNYWFSYRTITNLLRKTGFDVVETYAYTFQAHHLVPRRFRRVGQPKATLQTTVNSTPMISSSQRARFFLRSLPKRLAVSLLYRTTPFWGDGIIVVAKAAVTS